MGNSGADCVPWSIYDKTYAGERLAVLWGNVDMAEKDVDKDDGESEVSFL